MRTRLSSRLCAEPACGEVGVDVAGGWRCPEHRRTSWDRFRAAHPERSSYGSDWTRVRDRFIAEHPTCACGAPATEVHHIDHCAPGAPTFLDVRNLEAVCTRCHRRRVA